MDSKLFRRLRGIFEAAPGKSVEAQSSFLRGHCEGGPGLQAEVEELFKAGRKTDPFLDGNLHLKSNGSDPGNISRPLPAGTVLCGRYEIVRMVGAGGMGAVYEALDKELEPVAIKLILPEYSGRKDFERRFREEILLARHVTHPNVVRIFSLEKDGNLLFITMEFVKGQDLATLLQDHGKYSPREAGEIICQAVSGIEAVHDAGVLHRDLKTRNLMRQPNGRVVVMDFGLARPLDNPARTVTAGMIGTFAYMAPEQLRGEPSDQRADLYSLGLVFHELLTGRLPSLAESKQERRRDILSEAIPPQAAASAGGRADRELNRIVRKCLEPSPNDRYQSAKELKEDIGNWLVPPKPPPRFTRWTVGAAALAAALALVPALLVLRHPAAPTSHPPVTVLIADFDNRTGDSVFSNGMLESVLGIALEGSPFISLYSRGAAHSESKRLSGVDELSEERARLVAVRDGIQSVVSGSLERKGEQYVIRVGMADVDGKTPPFSRDLIAPSREAVVSSVGEAAQAIRRALGEKKPAPLSPETLTSSSLDAAHAYALGQEFVREGKATDAIPQYLHAIALDPNLGRAYSGLAVIYRNRNRTDEALKYFSEALKHFDRMTDREKYRTRGAYYVTSGSPDKAIEEYSELVKQYPADNAGWANLAVAWSMKRDMTKAIEYGREAVNIYPRNVAQRTNLGWYLLFEGRPAEAVTETQKASEYSPSYEKAYLVRALAEMVQGNVANAAKTYNELRQASADGASLATLGMADIALYEGRTGDAIRLLENGAKVDLVTSNETAAAIKLGVLAQSELGMGNENEASKTALQADAFKSKPESVLFELARVFMKSKPERAAEIASQLSRELDPYWRSYGLLLDGELALQKQDVPGAIADFEQAIHFVDTWLARYDLGLAYLKAHKYLEADTELEACIRRRGEATSLFVDDTPTFRDFPPVYYYHGLAEDGLGTSSQLWYEKFLSTKTGGGPDPMIEDARTHLNRKER